VRENFRNGSGRRAVMYKTGVGKDILSFTCNALEWIYSYGGGSVIEPDKIITINNPNAIKALDNAHSGWHHFTRRGYYL
jgi:hypothetical protein